MYMGKHGCLSVLSKLLDGVAKKNYTILKYIISIMTLRVLQYWCNFHSGYVQRLSLLYLNKVSKVSCSSFKPSRCGDFS